MNQIVESLPEPSPPPSAIRMPTRGSGVEPAPRWRPRLRWFAAEFLVVVSGVLVALALNAWWQGRTNEGRERAYLHQLLEDFRANEREVDAVVRMETEVWGSANRLYRAAHLRGPLPPSDSLRLWLQGSLFLPSFRVRAATWEALVHTGEIGLIRNDVLRNRLIDFAGRLAYTHDRVGKLTDAGMEEIKLVLRRVDEYELLDERARAAVGWADLETRFPVRWEELFRDIEFVSVVNITGKAAQGRSIEIGRLEEPIREIVMLLEEELSRKRQDRSYLLRGEVAR